MTPPRADDAAALDAVRASVLDRMEQGDRVMRRAIVGDDEFDPELVAELPRRLDALPPACRVVLRMHYLDALTYVELSRKRWSSRWGR